MTFPRRITRHQYLTRRLLAVASLSLSIAGTQSARSQPASQAVVLQYDHGLFAQAPSDVAFSKRNDLQLTIDSRWLNNYGYRPVRLKFTAQRPTVAEHRITFRLRVLHREQPTIEVERTTDMPRGAIEHEFVVRVPQFSSENQCEWDVWVDGVRDPELCVDRSTAWDTSLTGAPFSTYTSLKCIVVTKDARPGALRAVHSAPITATTVAPADLPAHWIDYSSIDVVALTPEVLQLLEKTRPDAMTALRRWIRTGGQLWVHSVGEDWEHLDDLERTLEIDSVQPPQLATAATIDPTDEADGRAIARGWRPLPIASEGEVPSAPGSEVPTSGISSVRGTTPTASPAPDEGRIANDDPARLAAVATATSMRDSIRWYLQRPVGFGRVRVYRGEWDPIGFSLSWQLLGGWSRNESPPSTPLTVAVETASEWHRRHGMTPDLANAEFADFLIPGVGLAPVTEFRVLITMFVLAIGPLNYWLLMRADRLHLLLFTVPALALGLTASLFGYAFLSDGMSTQIRVRSVTTLDQTTGEAACWARLSYYASLAPGDGLVLADDVAFYPILSGWDESRDAELEVARTVQWRDAQQRLSKGWLRSRVPTQYLSIRARKTPARIQLEQDDVRLVATNKLGTRIEYLAVVDESGNISAGEAIDDGVRVELQASTHSDALRVLRERIVAHQPRMPPELAGSQEPDSLSHRRQQYFRRFADPQVGIERLSENALDRAIADLVAPTADGVLNLPPRSYVAVTATGPEVDLGLPDAEEEASFHLLLGNW